MRLGATQQQVLQAIEQHKGWSPGCGWIWNNRSGTLRIIESLVKKGLVDKNDDVRFRQMYQINAAGKAMLCELFPVQYGKKY